MPQAEAPGPLQAIWLAGLGLVLASVDDDELRLLAAMAEERDRAGVNRLPATIAPPTVRTRDETHVPAPLYALYVAPYEKRFAGDLSYLVGYSSALSSIEVSHPLPVRLPGSPQPRRKEFRRLAVGKSEGDRKDLRDIMVYGLRSQLWEARRIGGTLVTFESLKRVQGELRRFLDDLIAFHSGDVREKQGLRQNMNNWVVAVTKLTPIISYRGIDPDSGVLQHDPIRGDFWSSVLASLFRLLPTFGPQGVSKCPNCGWYFHPAIWLKVKKKSAKYCTRFCKMAANNKRPKKSDS